MYDNLGIHWASTIPSFIALTCVPFPFLFYSTDLTSESSVNSPEKPLRSWLRSSRGSRRTKVVKTRKMTHGDPERKTELTMEPEAVEAARSDAQGGDPKSRTRLQSLESKVEKAEV